VLYKGKVQGLTGIMGFLRHSTQNTVIMCDADVVSNLDIEELVDFHEENGADITVVYQNGGDLCGIDDIIDMKLDETGLVQDIRVSSKGAPHGNFALDIVVISKALLMDLVTDAAARNLKIFGRDILQRNVNKLKIYGYPAHGYTAVIDSIQSYMNANMDLLKPEVRAALFPKGRPVYTKSRDDMPAKYGLSAFVKNSLIADGCRIEGTVENSILFRGVQIGKGAVVRNSMILQDTNLGKNAALTWVITDKDVAIQDGRVLTGFDSYPVFIAKGSIV
jgi:glucose-1-phosphate adenylyltransferase